MTPRRIRRHHGHGACRKCGYRIARGGLDRCCVQCARASGILPPLPPDRAKYAVRKDVPKVWVPSEWQQPRPAIRKVIDGVEFAVVWDGA